MLDQGQWSGPSLPQLPGKAASMDRNFAESLGNGLTAGKTAGEKAVPESGQKCRVQVCLKEPWRSCAKDKGLFQGESLDGRESGEDGQGYGQCPLNQSQGQPARAKHSPRMRTSYWWPGFPRGSVGKEPHPLIMKPPASCFWKTKPHIGKANSYLSYPLLRAVGNGQSVQKRD